MKFQGDILNFGDFIQVFVFTSYHHLKQWHYFANGHIILYTAIKFTTLRPVSNDALLRDDLSSFFQLLNLLYIRKKIDFKDMMLYGPE